MGFAEQMGIISEKEAQIDHMDRVLRNRLWNCLRQFILADPQDSRAIANEILDSIGELNDFSAEVALEEIEKAITRREWYVLYDLIENAIQAKFDTDKYSGLNPLNGVQAVDHDMAMTHKFIDDVNKVLEKEKSGYRLYKQTGKFIKVFDEEEFQSIEETVTSPFDSVNQHISKALLLYSRRENPDYENSIKESISAVEAMCSIITGETGSNATLGKMLKKLEDHGIVIHSSLRSAFHQMYGYTSDSSGIRHGGIDFTHASEEDAKYMLVICSAFVNYLKVKYSKITA